MAQDEPFVHLHVHTEFSLLDGLSRIKDLVGRAKELDMSALAITDHGTMFGVMDFYDACKAADIKPIIGLESYLAPRGMEDRDPKEDRNPYHMLLIAENDIGYKNLLKISSEGQLRGYYYRPRIDWDFLQDHSEGLIATSGCLAAKIPRMVQDGLEAQAHEEIGKFTEVFGKDHFYLELQKHDIDLQRDLNHWLIDYNRTNHTNVGLIATSDLHYVRAEDHEVHDALLCIQTGSLISDEARLKFTDNTYYMYSPAEMWDLYREVPEALHNTVKIAEMCDTTLRHKGYHLPNFPVPDGYDAQSYLRYLCEKGMDWRFGSRKDDPVLVKRLARELGIIHDMGFDTYFLIVWDLCEFARYADIWWNVRGSGAGSLAAYCLGITNIDPIQNNLLFERFLNPGRVSMPDIDLDYPDDRRGEMIGYAAKKYGEDKVAAIITFGTLGPKAAVRDVGRVMDVPLPVVNQAASLIPQEPRPKPLMDYVDNIVELKQLYNTDSQVRSVIDTAKKLQGVSRHASTHAAGVIIADRPLVDYIPLHRITGKDPSGGALKAVTQFPMETSESIGLLKVDFLGLSTLTIMRKAAELIEKHHGIAYTMDTIPYRHDDPRLTDEQRKMLDEAFVMMGRGETVGVFQVESSGMQQMLREMRPKIFENIIAGISLYRPGPMEFIPQYNRRLHDEEETEYRHERLESILAETYGIIVYQEQIMQIAGELFGYELGEADLMRRAVSKKKQKDLVKHREIFLERGPENGINEDAAGKIFDDIEFFANYGFNKSHASDYAVITVQTAYLKCHYPEEYMAALLTVQRDDSSKVAHFLEECRRLNIPVLPPAVEASALDFDIQKDPETGKRGIRFGLAAIKNAGANALTPIIEERSANGPFTDLVDFCTRVDLRKVGKRTLESLIKVGAMERFGLRSQLLEALERMMGFSANHFKDQEVGQMNMFGEATGLLDDSLNHLPQIEEVSSRELLGWEKELLGLYVSGRPVDKFREVLERSASTDVVQQMKQYPEHFLNREKVQIAGEIVTLRRIYTKNNDSMAVAQIEDWHDSAGTMEVVLFPRTWDKVLGLIESEELSGFEEGMVVKIRGKFDTSRGDPQIIVDDVTQNFEFTDHDGERPNFESDLPVWVDEEEDITPAVAPDQAPPWAQSNGDSAPPPRSFSDEDVPAWLEDEDVYDEETGEVEAGTPDEADTDAVTTPITEVPPVLPEGYVMPDFLRQSDARKQRWLKIFFPRSGDDNIDRRRLAHLYGILTQYPGQDRFSITIESRQRSMTLEYPNATTSYSEALVEELLQLVNTEDNIEVYEAPDGE